MEAQLEAQFNTFNLGVSWSVFGNADRSDLDDLLATKNIHGEDRLTIVDLWKNHPKRQPQGTVQQTSEWLGFLLFLGFIDYGCVVSADIEARFTKMEAKMKAEVEAKMEEQQVNANEASE